LTFDGTFIKPRLNSYPVAVPSQCVSVGLPGIKWRGPDSNRRPFDYESNVIPNFTTPLCISPKLPSVDQHAIHYPGRWLPFRPFAFFLARGNVFYGCELT
jgi:hypothetical protein